MPAARSRGGRWETRFGRWVAEYGVAEIVKQLRSDPDLRVTKKTVYDWLRGHAPRPARAAALVRLSRGAITLDCIYRHVRQERSRRLRTAKRRETSGERKRARR